MKKEKSCGAIIYCVKNNKIFYLIEYTTRGYISFPKGHVEENETEEETALREIKEEINLDVVLDTSFRVVTTYNPKKDVIKDLVLFVAEITFEDKNASLHNDEVDFTKWLSYEEVLEILEHENAK